MYHEVWCDFFYGSDFRPILDNALTAALLQVLDVWSIILLGLILRGSCESFSIACSAAFFAANIAAVG